MSHTTTDLLPIAEAAKRAGVNKKTFRRWAAKRGTILLVGVTNRQHVTIAEADAIADLMKPRPVTP